MSREFAMENFSLIDNSRRVSLSLINEELSLDAATLAEETPFTSFPPSSSSLFFKGLHDQSWQRKMSSSFPSPALYKRDSSILKLGSLRRNSLNQLMSGGPNGKDSLVACFQQDLARHRSPFGHSRIRAMSLSAAEASKKQVSFVTDLKPSTPETITEEEVVDYGYEDLNDMPSSAAATNDTKLNYLESTGFTAATMSCDSSARKRRRYQRRNSKTPAMLMKMLSPILNDLHTTSDFTVDSQQQYFSTTTSSLDNNDHDEDNETTKNLDMSIEVAEDLVLHLQKRRKLHAVGL
jgi:hypothetical protein